MITGSGCDSIRDVAKLFGYQPKKTLPSEVKEEMNHATDAPGGQTAGALAKANSELLSEMLKVVFNQEKIEDKSEFGTLVHTLNQGASLEGIYHGLIMGSRYRALESSSKASSPRLLKIFAFEIVELQVSMKNPTEFEAGESKKAPTIEFPDGNVSIPLVNVKNTQDVKQKKDKKVAMTEMLELFIGASPYTLKRVLADEALKKLDELKDSPGDLARWYAQFVLHMCDTKVDFGLELRNRPDFDFHFKFAQNMAPDRVKWEVLNRYHRYLNFVMDHE